MVAAVELRTDFDAAALRQLARRSKDSGQARRLLALAEVYDGRSRSEAAEVGGVTLQSIRDWVLRLNECGPEGLIDLKAPGPAPKLDEKQRQALKEIVERGPIPAVDGVVRWRLGQARKPPQRATRSAHQAGRYLRRHLSGHGRGHRSGAAVGP